MIYKTFIALLGAILFSLLDINEALAWGPGVHLHTANYVLSNLQFIASHIANIVSAYPHSFKYGCLSADIYMGKGKKLHSKHCHNWETAFRLLECKDDSIRSYGYGYLSHLAADTIAHNFYVPNTLSILPGSGKMSHVYVEMQADRVITGVNKQAHAVMGTKDQKADKILRLVLQKPKLPFALKKQLYKQGVAFSRLQSWEVSLRLLDLALPVGKNGYLDQMLDLSRATVVNFLQEPQLAYCLDYDPMGFENLRTVKEIKKDPGMFTRIQEKLFTPDPKLMDLTVSPN